MEEEPDIPDFPADLGDDGDDELIPLITNTSTTRQTNPDDEEETSFGGNDDTINLIRKEDDQDYAWDEIIRKFPNVNTSKFTANTDKYGRVFLQLIRGNRKKHFFLKTNGEVNDKLPLTIKKNLGPRAEEVVEANDGEISKRKTMISRLKETLKFHMDKPLKTPEIE